jgi:integrase
MIGTDNEGYLFPADRDRVKVGNEPKTPHIAGRSIAHAMARLRAKCGVEDVVVHDFRRSISTWLGERDERIEVIDKILNHQPRGVTAKHYNHARLLPQTRVALQKWADNIERIVSGASERTNVVKISA